MQLTQALIKKYAIEIKGQTIWNLCLPRPVTVYFVRSDVLQVNWSGTGVRWLREAKKDLLKIIALY